MISLEYTLDIPGVTRRLTSSYAVPWLLLRRRGAPPSPPASAPDLLAAIVAYLRGNAPITNALQIGFGDNGFGAMGFGGGGAQQIYFGKADANAMPPYLIIPKYCERAPGESLDDETVDCPILLVSNDLDEAIALGVLVKAQLDTPQLNSASPRTAPLVFTGGTEIGLYRNPTEPRRMPGIGKMGRYVYVEQIEYQFWVSPEF